MSTPLPPLRQRLEKMVETMEPQSLQMGLLLSTPILSPIARYIKEKTLHHQITTATPNSTQQLDAFRQRKDVRFISYFSASVQLVSAIAFGILSPPFGIVMGTLAIATLVAGLVISKKYSLPQDLEANLEQKLQSIPVKA